MELHTVPTNPHLPHQSPSPMGEERLIFSSIYFAEAALSSFTVEVSVFLLNRIVFLNVLSSRHFRANVKGIRYRTQYVFMLCGTVFDFMNVFLQFMIPLRSCSRSNFCCSDKSC